MIHIVQQQSNPYSNTYNTEWRNQSNFSWEDQGNHGNFSRPFHQPGFQQREFQQESKKPWEVAIEMLANGNDGIEASHRNVEVQSRQLVKSIYSWGQ